MFTFTPEETSSQLEVKYMEDARASDYPYSSFASKGGPAIERRLIEAQSEIGTALMQMGAMLTGIVPGTYRVGDHTRHGYEIRFTYGGRPAIIRVAGLPIRNKETPRKVNAVRVQALLTVRDWLTATVTGIAFAPGAMPLVSFMLVDETRTVADMLVETGNFPQLATPVIPEKTDYSR